MTHSNKIFLQLLNKSVPLSERVAGGVRITPFHGGVVEVHRVLTRDDLEFAAEQALHVEAAGPSNPFARNLVHALLLSVKNPSRCHPIDLFVGTCLVNVDAASSGNVLAARRGRTRAVKIKVSWKEGLIKL